MHHHRSIQECILLRKKERIERKEREWKDVLWNILLSDENCLPEFQSLILLVDAGGNKCMFHWFFSSDGSQARIGFFGMLVTRITIDYHVTKNRVLSPPNSLLLPLRLPSYLPSHTILLPVVVDVSYPASWSFPSSESFFKEKTRLRNGRENVKKALFIWRRMNGWMMMTRWNDDYGMIKWKNSSTKLTMRVAKRKKEQAKTRGELNLSQSLIKQPKERISLHQTLYFATLHTQLFLNYYSINYFDYGRLSLPFPKTFLRP